MKNRCLSVLAAVSLAASFGGCKHEQAASVSVDGAAETKPAGVQTQAQAVTSGANGSGNAVSSAANATSPNPSSQAAPAVSANSSKPKVVTSEKTATLVVAQHTFRFVSHLQRVEGTNEDTVDHWELRGANDRVIYQQSYPVSFQDGQFEDTVSVDAEAFNTQQGGGILIHGMDLPSAPDSGGWVQVFGYKYGRDKYGADESLFGPLAPPISITGEFLGVEADPTMPSPVKTGGATMTVMHDLLKFRLRTGTVDIVYPVLINWITGRLEPRICTEMTSKGQVQRCSYPVIAEPARSTEATFVRLFPEPDDGFTAKHVVVQPQSKVEFLEARASVGWAQDANSVSFGVDGDLWVKIRVDGKEGWIHGQEDFDAVGLPLVG
jgi:hypothetical protein